LSLWKGDLNVLELPADNAGSRPEELFDEWGTKYRQFSGIGKQ
jgi:hypothetical protein